jgi:hypothetical protein
MGRIKVIISNFSKVKINNKNIKNTYKEVWISKAW